MPKTGPGDKDPIPSARKFSGRTGTVTRAAGVLPAPELAEQEAEYRQGDEAKRRDLLQLRTHIPVWRR
jgi:hypothetical protein